MISVVLVSIFCVITLYFLIKSAKKKVIPIKSKYNIPMFLQGLWSFTKGVFSVFIYIRFVLMLFCSVIIVASGSMTPALETNDLVIHSNLPYGFKLSNITETIYKPGTFLSKSFFAYTEPKQGDVMTFKTDFEKDMVFTKRIAAKGGDKVTFRGGIMFINDEAVKLEYLGPYTYQENEKFIKTHMFKETLPNGVSYKVLYDNHPIENVLGFTETFIVPKDHFFMVGDNRDHSEDSRNFISFVPKEYIRGRVFYILLSNGNGSTLNIFKFIKGMKWSKCFTWIK